MVISNKRIIVFVGVLIVGFLAFFLFGKSFGNSSDSSSQQEKLEGSVLSVNKEYISIQDKNHIIYTFKKEDIKADVGDNILLEYSGILDKNKEVQDLTVVNLSFVSREQEGIPLEWSDDGIFKDYYNQAYKKLETMSLTDKIGQLFLVRYPDSNAIDLVKKYGFGGYVFFAKDFKNKTTQEVKDMMASLQSASPIPLLTAVDEEGGKIVRISSNENLVSEPFKSSKELYDLGGFPKITEDTKTKSRILSNLGLNLNLAPVVDVSTNPSDYMYERSFGKDTNLTSTYAKTVISAGKGTGVSYTLKHFPGYGNNADTHQSSATDSRELEDIINNDLPPFESGIQAGAEAVLVSHNIVTSIDANHPASLSPSVHNILRNRLNFTGIIITDDMDMGATSSIDQKSVEAILAGNDLIIVTDYEESIREVKKAIQDGDLSEELIDKLAFRILAWKYYKGLLQESQEK